MTISSQECESILSGMTDGELSRLLSLLGHELTVIARTAYEFQGSGVTDPRFLRDLNEIWTGQPFVDIRLPSLMAATEVLMCNKKQYADELMIESAD